MYKLALVALLCAQAFARPQEVEIEPYIVNGTKAKEGDYPFAVSIRTPNSNVSYCGGALISDKYVLTAAHCVSDKKPVTIGVGSVNLKSQTMHEVDKFIIHPRFDSMARNKNDVALLRLKTPVKLGGNIQTINFPVTENMVGKTGTAMGWGRTAPNEPYSQVLLYQNRPIISHEECTKLIKMEVNESQICLLGSPGKGMCFGDGGNPMLYKGSDGKNYIAGITSWGVCGDGNPDVFIKVSYYSQWIQKNMV